jgi:putative membrane protein
MTQKENKLVIGSSIAISGVAFLFLVWLIYLKQHPVGHVRSLAYLPALNSLLNGLSAISLVSGIVAIKQKKQALHKILMVLALAFSTLFLVSYIVYHAVNGDTIFLGQGLIRPVYFFVLISHILLTLVALPLILTTVGMALFSNFNLHKKIARWTFPLWLYVSVTGVLIYFLLKIWG